LFAIGAYHLIGPKVNVITHLQDRGYKIRQLTPRDAGELQALYGRVKTERKKAVEKTKSAPAK
jgi:hypothetical protein